MVIIIGAPIAIIGFFMLEFLPDSKPAAKYGALYLAATGYYSFYPIYITWVSYEPQPPLKKHLPPSISNQLN